MSNRKPKRKQIKIDPSLLTDKNKIDRFSWLLKRGNQPIKVTLNPTKGYSIQKLQYKNKGE